MVKRLGICSCDILLLHSFYLARRVGSIISGAGSDRTQTWSGARLPL